MKTKVLLIALFVLNIFQVSAQSVDEVTLVVSSDGATKEEATMKALRSAIEQTYGAFVSANTEILNDELVRDEIITISNGNIKKYEEIAHSTLPNGNQYVTLNATVCISKLVSYAQSKGVSAELAGATFAMNLKMEEFYKKNERIAIDNMFIQLNKLVNDIPNLFDYELSLKEPDLSWDGETVEIRGEINILSNANTFLIKQFLINSLFPLQSNAYGSKRSYDSYFPFLIPNPRNGIYSNTYRIRNSGFIQMYRALCEIVGWHLADKVYLTLKANTDEIFDIVAFVYENNNEDKLSIDYLHEVAAGNHLGGSLKWRVGRDNMEVYYDAGTTPWSIVGSIISSELEIHDHQIQLELNAKREKIINFSFILKIPKDKIGNYSKFEVVNLMEEQWHEIFDKHISDLLSKKK